MSQILKTKKKKQRLVEIPFVEESSTSSEEYIHGPLRIWPYPLLNALFMFFKRLRSLSSRSQSPRKRKRMTIYSLNRDENGRIIDIIERELEVVE